MLADASSGAFLGDDLLAYLLLAFGGAMLVGNLLAVFRPPPAQQAEGARAPLGRSLLMAGLGAVAFVWALASLFKGMSMPTVDPGERRRFATAGLVLLGALIVLVGLVAVLARGEGDERTGATTTVACAPGDAACLAAQRAGERPGIIPRPGEGAEPAEAGEPGGAAQVALFFGLVVALAVIVGLVVRSVRRNAANRTPS